MSRKIEKIVWKWGEWRNSQGRKKWAELEGAKLQNVCSIHLLRINYKVDKMKKILGLCFLIVFE